MPPPAKRSIGQVLPLLKNEFPDISISKIRFLESEGLVSPERAPSGYRRYAEADIDRLRYILRMQRDHYLPLKVIRQNLEMMDRGIEPPTIESPASSNSAASAAPETDPQDPATGPRPAQKRPMKLTRRELEILRLVAGGRSNKEIGKELSITEGTVKSHVHNALEKLHMTNRIQAAAYFVRQGLGLPDA